MFNLGLAAIAWVLVLVLTASFIPYAFESDGFKITSVTSGGPAEGVLKEGMIVSNINGYPMNDRSAYTELILNKSKPGDQLTYVTDQGTYTITTTGNPNNESITYPGTRSETHLVVKEDVSKIYGNTLPWFLYNLAEVAYWVYLLNLLVGLFNLLPMKPLDGGVIFEELLGYKVPEKYVKKITSSISMVMMGIVAILIIYGTIPGILRMFNY